KEINLLKHYQVIHPFVKWWKSNDKFVATSVEHKFPTHYPGMDSRSGRCFCT
ncbi:hypothetical protein MKX01_006802, partial [Papaver californicum]